MALAFIGRAAAASIAATSGPSQSRRTMFTVLSSDVPDLGGCVGIGASVAAPVTYLGLGANRFFERWADGSMDTLRVSTLPDTNFDIIATFFADLSAFTVGQSIWMCLFSVATPVDASVPVAVFDLGPLVA
jgi:hypothetical protein